MKLESLGRSSLINVNRFRLVAYRKNDNHRRPIKVLLLPERREMVLITLAAATTTTTTRRTTSVTQCGTRPHRRCPLSVRQSNRRQRLEIETKLPRQTTRREEESPASSSLLHRRRSNRVASSAPGTRFNANFFAFVL